MPTFCRHNRFVERCPICSRTLPGNEPTTTAPRGAGAAARRAGSKGPPRRHRAEGLRVRREGRAAEDGYGSPLVPGIRASADAERLADELAFSSARLIALVAEPPGSYHRALELAAEGSAERAAWACFLIAYLTPAETDEPFATIERALAAAPLPERVGDLEGLLEEAEVGPRSSHRPGSGTGTLRAYAQWAQRSGEGRGQAGALTGDAGWDEHRRFARLYERLALPGLSRAGRFELLVTLGRLGLYELSADSLHLATPRGAGGEDQVALAAKRVFGIADPLLLDRRAASLAEAVGVPLEALDLALFNWGSPQRATMGFRPEAAPDAGRISAALGL